VPASMVVTNTAELSGDTATGATTGPVATEDTLTAGERGPERGAGNGSGGHRCWLACSRVSQAVLGRMPVLLRELPGSLPRGAEN
jgi:hypothetical protein